MIQVYEPSPEHQTKPRNFAEDNKRSHTSIFRRYSLVLNTLFKCKLKDDDIIQTLAHLLWKTSHSKIKSHDRGKRFTVPLAIQRRFLGTENGNNYNLEIQDLYYILNSQKLRKKILIKTTALFVKAVDYDIDKRNT